jgi:hypothetical protein
MGEEPIRRVCLSVHPPTISLEQPLPRGAWRAPALAGDRRRAHNRGFVQHEQRRAVLAAAQHGACPATGTTEFTTPSCHPPLVDKSSWRLYPSVERYVELLSVHYTMTCKNFRWRIFIIPSTEDYYIRTLRRRSTKFASSLEVSRSSS